MVIRCGNYEMLEYLKQLKNKKNKKTGSTVYDCLLILPFNVYSFILTSVVWPVKRTVMLPHYLIDYLKKIFRGNG